MRDHQRRQLFTVEADEAEHTEKVGFLSMAHGSAAKTWP
jgi:hypothetical protein